MDMEVLLFVSFEVTYVQIELEGATSSERLSFFLAHSRLKPFVLICDTQAKKAKKAKKSYQSISENPVLSGLDISLIVQSSQKTVQ